MKIGIVGAGPAGVMAAVEALKDKENEITLIDKGAVLATILPTGGGRCNLAFAQFDNSQLVKNYPRGEKFLLSVFSRFSTGDTIQFFEEIGVKTYIQDDMRVFPVTNSAKTVREAFLKQFKGAKVKFVKEKVVFFEKVDETFTVKTEKSQYSFDKLIFAGGIKNNHALLKNAGIKLVEPRPALCALQIKEIGMYSLAGTVLKNLSCKVGRHDVFGDLLITHKSISGPLAYKISSLMAYCDFPYDVCVNFSGLSLAETDKRLIQLLNENSKKNFANIVSGFVSHAFALYLLKISGIDVDIKASSVSKEMRLKIAGALSNFNLTIINQVSDGEIVTAGGVKTDFINPKTMEYKGIEGLHFCGEVLDVDGFTGGFNLQNCWSTGYLAGHAMVKNI